MPGPLTIDYENLARSNAPYFDEMERAANRVIRSGWYVLGQEVAAFESEFAQYGEARHCVGVGNGLDALTLAFEALALPRGSDVLVASNSYIATILAIIRAGHRPVLVEPVPETFNLDPERLDAALTDRTRALCVTHLFGKSCRMDGIVAFTRRHGLRLVEDCAQSHGAKWNGKLTGTFGDAGCFSFFPTKNLGALGDGGAVLTDDDDLADRVRHLRNYGSKEKYVHHYVGANSRLDEIQAAMLRVKLDYLDALISHKRALADLYFELLPDWVIKPVRNAEEFDVYHIFGIRCDHRNALQTHLRERGVGTAIHYPIPPHKQEAYKDWNNLSLPITEQIHNEVLSLPISPVMPEDEVSVVIELINTFS